jgi:cytochrome c-type biogenesis protein CcmH
MVRRWIVLLGLALWLTGVHGREAPSVAGDPALEARVQVLAEQLRCLVCQNQNLADSHAELAVDLKDQMREMLKKGQSEQDVIDFMVQRYGDFVLYKPPVKATTWLLWGGPFVLLAAGLVLLSVRLRRRRGEVGAELTPEQRAAARRLLDDHDREVA